MTPERRRILRRCCIGGALLCFAFLAWQIATHDSLPFDTAVRTWVYGLRTPARNRVITCITYLGNWQTITVLLACLLCVPKTRRSIGAPLTVTTVASTLLYRGMKEIFARPRPELAVRLIHESGWSFPSGHSMNGLVCYGMLLFLVGHFCGSRRTARCVQVGLGILIVAIGCSRVYVGVHFPTDVLGGWSLGLAFLLTAQSLWEKSLWKKREDQCHGSDNQ